MSRFCQCSEVVHHLLSPYHFTEPEVSSCQNVLRSLSHQDNCTEASEFRGDVPRKKVGRPLPPGFDESGHLNESTVGSQGYFTASTADYSSQSYRSKIATFSSGISEAYTKPSGLQRASFMGGINEADNKPLSINRKCVEPSLEPSNVHNATICHNQTISSGPEQWKSNLHVTKKLDSITDERKLADSYKKESYAVLIGNSVRICNTKLYASLPLCNKYMVKDRVKDASGITRVKLSLKTFESSRLVSKKPQ